MVKVLATLQPLDTSDGSRPVLRVCNTNDRAVSGYDSQQWWPAIARAPAISIDLFDGDFSHDIAVAAGGMQLRLDALRRADADSPAYTWSKAPVEIFVWDEDAGTASSLMTARVERMESADEVVNLTFQVDTEPFETDVLTAQYAGTGDEEGGADLTGRLKPWVFGRAKNVEPVLIDATNNVWQVSGYGAVNDIPTVYERGSAFGASEGDEADYAALVAASIPEGSWATCLAEGMFRLGAPAYGLITADVEGDAADTTYRQRTGAILQYIASELGISSSLIDATSFNALDTARAYDVNIYLTEQTSFLDLARRMVRPLNAVAGIGFDGVMFVSTVDFDTSTVTFDAQGREWPPVAAIAEQPVRPPYKRIMMGADRCWRVHGGDEIAFGSPIVPRGRYDGSTLYVEGNLVNTADAAEWLYINNTPTSGNAPPTWPTTSNTWWENVTPPGVNGTKTAPVTLYKRGATAPAVPSGDVTYTFATAGVSGTLDSWTQAVPSGTDPVWRIDYQAVDTAATVTIGTGDWTSPVKVFQDGDPGSPGSDAKALSVNSRRGAFLYDGTGTIVSGQSATFDIARQNLSTSDVVVRLYNIAITGSGGVLDPGTYLTGSGTVTDDDPDANAFTMDGDTITLTGSSFASFIALSPTNYLGMEVRITADGITATESIIWVADGAAGDPGDPGDPGANGQAIDIVYQRSATQPSTPADSAGVPAGWYADPGSVPAGSNPIWSSVGERANPGDDFVWQAAVQFQGVDGDDGANGLTTGAYLAPPLLRIPVDASGNPTSYTGMESTVVIIDAAGTDISSNFSLAVTQNDAALSGPYGGTPSESLTNAMLVTITGGFTAAESPAYVEVTATGSGAYSGIEFTVLLTVEASYDAVLLDGYDDFNAGNNMNGDAIPSPSVAGVTFTYSRGAGDSDLVRFHWTAGGGMLDRDIDGWEVQTYIATAAESDGISSVASEIVSPQAMCFGALGYKAWVAAGSAVFQYELTTPYDITTAVYHGKWKSLSGTLSSIYGMAISTDGTAFFAFSNQANDTVYQFTLSDKFDIETATYASKSLNGFGFSLPGGMAFNAAGTRLFVSGYTNSLRRYDLSTAWDLATASFVSATTILGNPTGIAFSADGSILFVASANGTVYAYSSNYTTSLFFIELASLGSPMSSSISDILIAPDGSSLQAINVFGTMKRFDMPTANSLSGIVSPTASNGVPGTPYTFGTTAARESRIVVPAADRLAEFVVPKGASITARTRAYRRVNASVDSSGLILSNWAQSTAPAYDPYRPGSVTNVGGYTGGKPDYILGDIVDIETEGVNTDKVLTASIAAGAIGEGDWYEQGGTLVVGASGGTEQAMVTDLVVEGDRVVVDFVFAFEMDVTNPNHGDEFTFTVQCWAENQSTFSDYYSPDGTTIAAWTIRRTWDRPSASGGQDLKSLPVHMSFTFDNVLPAGTYDFGYKIVTNSGCGMTFQPNRYMRAQDLRAMT